MLILAPAAAVSAVGKPFHTEAPFVAFTVTNTCEFDVYWEQLADNGYFIIIIGILKSLLTYVETGKFVDHNISAQFTQTSFNDGSYQAVSHDPFIGPLAYIKGRQVVRYDPEGNLVEASQSGKVEYLCLILTDEMTRP